MTQESLRQVKKYIGGHSFDIGVTQHFLFPAVFSMKVVVLSAIVKTDSLQIHETGGTLCFLGYPSPILSFLPLELKVFNLSRLATFPSSYGL